MQVEAIGLEDIKETLEGIEEKTQKTLPLMRELKNHLYNVIRESFENEESPDGLKWSPIKFRKSDPTPEKILYADGNMQKSLYSDAKKWNLTVGINATSKGYAYPLVHQFGSTKKSGRGSGIVARPFMPIKSNGEIYEKTQKELEEVIDDWFDYEGIKR